MEHIKIVSTMDGITHDATFEPVRTAAVYTCGWATVEGETGTLRFPAVLTPFSLTKKHGGGPAVLTVSDWQADYRDVDLSDPLDIANLELSGSGKLCNPATGRSSDVWHHFMGKNDKERSENRAKVYERRKRDAESIARRYGA